MSNKTDSDETSLFGFRVGDALWSNVFKRASKRSRTTIDILKNVPLFKGMRKGELVEFEKIIHHRRYKPGEVIFYEDEPGVGMYIVEEGTVGIYKATEEGGREQLATLGRGEFFGELALLDESPRSASAVAEEECRILGLFRPDLLDLIERKPRLGSKFLFQLAGVIGERLKHTNEELQALWAKLEENKVIT